MKNMVWSLAGECRKRCVAVRHCATTDGEDEEDAPVAAAAAVPAPAAAAATAAAVDLTDDALELPGGEY
jgi:hypothetical protein